MALNLFINSAAKDPASAIVANAVNTIPAIMPTLVYGDQVEFNLYLVDGAGGYDSRSGDSGYTLRVAIGPTNSPPSGGSFTLTYGGDTTSALTYGATSAQVASALNALASIIADGGVTVTGAAPLYRVQWNDPGARATMTSDATSLSPTSYITNGVVQTGTGSIVAVQDVRMIRQPAAYQNSWAPITNGWNAVLELNTHGLAELLGERSQVTADFEVELTEVSTGYRTTIAKPAIIVRGEVIDQNAAVPTPVESYLTAAEIKNQFAQNRYLVTGLTGGGTNLDGIATAGSAATVGWLAAVVISNEVSFYRLETSTEATASPNWIRPTDYNGATNQRVWHLVSSTASSITEFADLGDFPGSVGQTVTPSAGAEISIYKLALTNSGGGSAMVLLTIAATNSTAGDLVYVVGTIPGALAELQVLDGPSAGTLVSFPSDPSGLSTSVLAQLFFDGTNWNLLDSRRSVDADTSYMRQGTLDAANRMLVTDASFNASTAKLEVLSNSAAPNATVKVSSITSKESTTDADVAIVPKGAGAFMLAVPDNAAGGNKRGQYSVDLQRVGGTSSVASGNYAFAAGSFNSAQGANSICVGDMNISQAVRSVAIGSNNLAQGESAFAFGFLSNALAKYSFAIGNSAIARTYGSYAFASGSLHGQGDAQMGIYTLCTTLTGATQQELLIDKVYARLVLTNGSQWTFEALVTAYCPVSGETDGWRFFGLIQRGANAAATAIVGSVVKEGRIGSTVWDFDVDADTTNGSLRLMATGESGKTIYWNAVVRTCEING